MARGAKSYMHPKVASFRPSKGFPGARAALLPRAPSPYSKAQRLVTRATGPKFRGR